MSTHRLVLLRHAKAVRDAGARDHGRPLTKRGRRDAGAVGRWLAEHDLRPNLVLVSDAVRARETWQCAAEAVPGVEVREEPSGYDAAPEMLLELVRGADEGAGTVALVAHNPGIEELAALLDDGSGPAEVRAALSEGLPTAGVVVLDLPAAWAELRPGSARLVDLSVPRG